ncbi:MAG: DUF2274 domain-containing protein [Proteobacteria bacterium]|nr:DUF2274 domain-containing protein [Pseudomonadota bacterium]
MRQSGLTARAVGTAVIRSANSRAAGSSISCAAKAVTTPSRFIQVVRRGFNVAATLTVRSGLPVSVIVTCGLVAHVEILARETGQPFTDPTKLIVPMLECFVIADRGGAKVRRQNNQENAPTRGPRHAGRSCRIEERSAGRID